eukprot:2309343-Lingulodinium_polyedra.AAC.1
MPVRIDLTTLSCMQVEALETDVLPQIESAAGLDRTTACKACKRFGLAPPPGGGSDKIIGYVLVAQLFP